MRQKFHRSQQSLAQQSAIEGNFHTDKRVRRIDIKPGMMLAQKERLMRMWSPLQHSSMRHDSLDIKQWTCTLLLKQTMFLLIFLNSLLFFSGPTNIQEKIIA